MFNFKIKIGFFYALNTARIGYISLAIILFKSTETLKYNWVLNSLEPMICAAQVPVQIFSCIYFRRLSIRTCTIKNFTVQMFLSFFILNALFFANNCLLSYLEFIAKARVDQ